MRLECELCGKRVKRRDIIKIKDFRGNTRYVCSECREKALEIDAYFKRVFEEMGEDWFDTYAMLVAIHTQGKDFSCSSCIDFQTGVCDGHGPGILKCMYEEVKEMKKRGLGPTDIIDII